jgi:hypothetical protein
VTRRSALRRSPAFALVAAFLLTFAAAPARAQNRAIEGQARTLQKKAMEEDYLTTEFGKAADKLNQAITKCGTTNCSPQLRALLRRDLGVVLIGGAIDAAKGQEAFVEALKLDPKVELDPDVKTKEIEQAFEQARRRAGGGATTAPAAGGEPAAAPQGDFDHTPAAEQVQRTPLPVYAEYGGSEEVVRVIARYRGFGMTEWKTVDLKRMGQGWGGLIPCTDVMQGDVKYYLQGFNAQNDPVATAGDRNNPYVVPIKRELELGDAPALPGQAAPKQCQDTGDCPPDFPGCKGGAQGAETVGKPEGEGCDEDDECASGKCKAGFCTAPKSKASGYKKFWVGVHGSFDLVAVPSEERVCSLDPNNARPFGAYYCVLEGRDYPRRPTQNDPTGLEARSIVPNQGNVVNGGIAPGTFRVMISADYAVNANILAGLRLGWAFNTYPGEAAGNDGRGVFAPLHAEVRGTYLIGKEVLANVGLAPYVFAGFGLQELSASVKTRVSENPEQLAPTERPAGATARRVEPDAWAISGPVFVAIGGGARYAFTPNTAIMFAPLKLTAAFGPNGLLPAISPELGVHVGF